MKLDQHQIATVLDEMAALLELTGENPFKVRAYQNAVRIIDGLGEDLEQVIAKEKLVEIKGIGKNLAAHITDLAKFGTLEEHRRLKKLVPKGVVEMLSIPGLGAKRVGLLWKKLGVTTIDELEKVCQKGKVAALEGFGAKSEEKILQGIDQQKRFSGRHLFDEAFVVARDILALLAGHRLVKRASIAGSLRRRMETIGDIDLLASSAHPNEVMEFFISLPLVHQVIAKGSTKSSVLLASGINADLRVVTDAEFPFALHYFTGSKEHNVALRSRAKAMDMKMNEYGLFKGKGERPLPCKDEEDIFARLGLPFIPPELRQDMGEIDAAAAGTLPHLVGFSDLQGVLHVHTTYSDGTASIEAMALAARERGYSYIGISDHSQSAAYAGGMKPARVKEQHREIDRLNKKLKGILILKGIEVDILADGSLDYNDDLLASFDFVIASIHSRFNMPETEMTKRICRAIRHPQVNILAHPTGRLLLKREPYAVNMHEVITCAAEHGVAIEINAHPQRLDLDWRLGPYARERGMKTVISPDAHSPQGIDHIAIGLGIARKGWFEKKDVINCLTALQFLKHFR